MTIDERRKYLRLIKKRHVKESQLRRGRLLDALEVTTSSQRKSLIRLMSASLERRLRHKQRGRIHGPEVDDALRVISESLDHVRAEHLQANVMWMGTHPAQHGEIEASPLLLGQLSRISVSMVRRLL